MGSKTKCTREEFIIAIQGSGGIKQIIAERLGVSRFTVRNYLNRWVSAREAYEQECQINLDIADSIIITNLRIQHKKQKSQDGKPGVEVDTSDAKWYLTMKGSRRGYAQVQRQHNLNLDMSRLTVEQLERIAAGENPLDVLTTPSAG